MLSKWTFISFVILTVFTSCKKENTPWNKEGNLTSDTSLYLNSVKYVSHTLSEAIFDFEIVEFNKLECESDYNNIYIGESNDTYFDLDVVSQSVEVRNPVAQYSSIFLIEESGNNLNYYGEASFYLSRYFEQIENKQPNKQIGIATFLADNSNTIKIHKEKGTLFGNSAAFNDSVLIDLVHKSDEYPGAYDSEGNGFIQVMFTAIDELITNPNTAGDQSVTLIDDYVNNNVLVFLDIVIDSIINKAVQNNVKINIVGLSGTQYSRLAMETGGFLIDEREAYKVNPTEYDYERSLSNVGNNIANLDRILSQNITVNKFRLRVSTSFSHNFISDSFINIYLEYNNDYFSLDLKIP